MINDNAYDNPGIGTTKLVINYADRFRTPRTIIALDQEKVYDEILYPYLWEALHKFEFPESFIRIAQYPTTTKPPQ